MTNPFAHSQHGNYLSLRREKWQLESWVDRFAFEGQDAEDAFVSEPQRLLANKSLQRLDSQREFPASERALSSNVTSAQPFEVVGQEVFRTVDNAEIFGTAALDGGLGDSPADRP